MPSLFKKQYYSPLVAALLVSYISMSARVYET